MKKYIITLLTLSMFLLTGCNNKPQTEEPVTSPLNDITESTEEAKPEKIKHEPVKDFSFEGWNGVGGLTYDFDSDGEDDELQIYSSAWFTPDEEPQLDDGANWMITVTTKNGVYKLFEDYIQSGLPQIDVGELYNKEPQKVIIFTQNSSAGKSITHYTFSDGAFYEELVYRTDDFTENGANIVESIEW